MQLQPPIAYFLKKSIDSKVVGWSKMKFCLETTLNSENSKYKKDRQLVTVCLEKDEKAWAMFIKKYKPLTRRIATKYRCENEFEDLFSEFLIKLIGGINGKKGVMRTYDGSFALSTFLLAIFRYIVIDYIRKIEGRAKPKPVAESFPGNQTESFRMLSSINSYHKKGGKKLVLHGENIEEHPDHTTNPVTILSDKEHAETCNTLTKAIKILPKFEQTIINLYYFQKLSFSQIAGRMDCSKSKICRNLQAVHAKLEAQMIKLLNRKKKDFYENNT